MLRRAIRKLIVGTPLEGAARGLFSRFDARCRASTAEMRDNPQMFEIMRRVLKPHSNCVDIGANEGDMLEQMARGAPKGDHHAFEPIPQLAAMLKQKFPKVHVHEMALDDRAGRAEFHVAETTGLSTLRVDAAMRKKTKLEAIDVAVGRLDDVLPTEYVPTLVKIDVEGAEYGALRGGREFLQRTRPFLIFEFARTSAKNFGTTAETMYDFIHGDLGLKISRMNDWLEGRAPLGREEFEKIFRVGLLWNFLAHSG